MHIFRTMNLDALLKAGITVSLVGVMVAQGMHVERAHLGLLLRHPARFVRSAFAVLVAVPLAALLVVAAVRPQANVAMGLVLLAASPISPVTLGKIAKAHGDVIFARALHFALALLAVVTTPLVLEGLSLALGVEVRINPGAVGRQVALALLAPMLIGAVINWTLPGVAARVREPLDRICLSTFTAIFALIVVVEFETLGRIGAPGYVAMFGLVVLALVLGHFGAGGKAETRTTVALESAIRNPGLAAFIAVFNLPSARPVAVLVPYLLISIVLTSAYAKVRGRGTPRPGRAPKDHAAMAGEPSS